MKKFSVVLVVLGLAACTPGQIINTVDDAHRIACDMLAGQQAAVLEREAQLQGISVVQLIDGFKASCLLRMSGVGAETMAGVQRPVAGCAEQKQ